MSEIIIDNHIASLRQQKKLTQEGLASLAGVSRQTIISIEKGNYVPSLSLAFSLATIFNLPLEKIFFKRK